MEWTSLRTECRALALGLLMSVVTGAGISAQTSSTVMATTADGVSVYGEKYFADLDESAPLVLAFHQGGSNGRGEYAEIAAWLNQQGYRVVAWDQRVGGATYGSENRTAAGLVGDDQPSFCAAYSDLEAALEYAVSANLAERVVLWGSSYSGSLVFRLASENPDRVAGVIAFSPASGGPMAECRASTWAGDVRAPVLVLRPASEMTRSSSVEQRDRLTAAGAEFHVVEHGIHGSSMLVDSRTGFDMAAARTSVLAWLERATEHQGS